MALSALGQQRFNELRTELQEVYGVTDLSEEFNVEPSIQQVIETNITESSSFLQAISTHGVDELSGAKIGMGFAGFIGKRTNTRAGHDRKSIDPHNLDGSDYKVNESEYDSHIDWLSIDTWAKFKDFYERWQAGVTNQIALNRIQVGWWGQYTAVETTNAGYAAAGVTPYDMGQDFHMGWLAYGIHWAGPDRVMGLNTDGTVKAIQVGQGGDYANLDALVLELCHDFFPRKYRKHPDHKAVIGDNLYHKEVMRLYTNAGDTPSEKNPLDMYIQQYQFGKKPVLDVPFFPEGCVMVTPTQNLAHYHQIGSHRRSIEQNKHRKCIEDFAYMREDFVVEDLDMFCMVHPDAIQIKDKDGNWVQANKEAWQITVPEGMEG